MASFIIYDSSTGVVRGAYAATHHDDTVMANNTPMGCSSLEVAPTSAVCADQRGWVVTSGVLQFFPATPVELLAAAKIAQSALVEAAYQNATFATAIPYMSTEFWADTDSQGKVTGLLVVYGASATLPTGFMFWDATNNGVPMTFSDMQGLALAIAGRENTNFVKRKTLLAEVQEAATVAAAQAIVW